MAQNTQHHGLGRRDLLKTIGFGAAVGIVGTGTMAGRVSAAHGAPETYRLVQGGTEYAVTPVTYTAGGSPVSIEDFYNYAAAPNLGGSNTPLELEENFRSRMFLYHDETTTTGGLYLVILHDDNSNEAGGTKSRQAFFQFSGLPADGSWVVDEDNDPSEDLGDAVDFYWQWFPRWSDGGAFGALACDPESDTGFSITVTPDFDPNPDGDSFNLVASDPWLAADGWEFFDAAGDGRFITLDETAELTVACDLSCECDLAEPVKFEYVYAEEDDVVVTDSFLPEEPTDAFSFLDYTSKGGEAYEPVAVTFAPDVCVDGLVATVKAGRFVETVPITEDAAGNLVVDIDYEGSPFRNDDNGQLYAISYVEFACV